MIDTEDFLLDNDIEFYKENNRIYINKDLDLDKLRYIPNYAFSDCTINGYLWLARINKVGVNFLRGAIINGNLLTHMLGLDLNDLTSVQEGFLKDVKITGNLCLRNLTYLPKGFRVDVSNRIYMPRLKSKMIRDLIEYPGIKRELGFNLLQ